MLLSFLLICGNGGAQGVTRTDPFLRQMPTQTSPTLRALPAVPRTAPSTPSSVNLAATPQNATFGNPRSSSSGDQTRIVFDLSPGVTYTLVPSAAGLTLGIQGARVVPMLTASLGSSVSGYRAGSGQVTVNTPFPLSSTAGWQASEATLASGNRVLILDVGSAVTGGASESLRALTRPPSTASVAAPAPLSAAPTPVQPTSTALARSGSLNQLPPGDLVKSSVEAPLAPASSSLDSARPSALTGRVSGQPLGVPLSAPRFSTAPGFTRVVLDLPPGTSYRIEPHALGVRIHLSNIRVRPQNAQDLSPELRSWRLEPTPTGSQLDLVTGLPTTPGSGWRAQVLAPMPGNLQAQLAIDLSPALANLTPLPAAERRLAAVPPSRATSGAALLALSAAVIRPRVVLDPGHGGQDPGAVASVMEKEVTLAVALRVRDLLRPAGVDVVLTRSTDQALDPVKSKDLEARAQLAGSGTQLFVSIHVNALEPQKALRGYGIETWWNPNHPLSDNLASLLQRRLIETTGSFSRGLKSNQPLAVLKNNRVPAALVEIGYTSHPVDGLNLQNNNYLDRVALGIAQGIRNALTSGTGAENALQNAGNSR
ncbi:N-acetylmuramoyl-L-alanine amidase [Deinococcus aquatilis]|uniref:N-acetylmuramoyl-L-alanine amidase family protein n=1 Tax=Deinococcus aquatilis TaxID=519440 RepID=UPI00036BBE54|nr:N-acetylmuramoyl-L-alanine amidase [Deinococcus aquatilis]